MLSIHLKLGERTCGIVGERKLAPMKPCAYLVNTARGPIVSEAAPIEALRVRRIAGAALDRFDEEPLAHQHPYGFLPNVLAIPHIGHVTENIPHHLSTDRRKVQAWLDGAPIRELLR